MQGSTSIASYLPGEPTPSQQIAIRLLERFCKVSSDSKYTFLLRGYAGTGKTTLTSALVHFWKTSGRPVVLLAPTGRAAKVMSKYTGMPAYTLHKYMYKWQEDSNVSEWSFMRKPNLLQKALFVVDESSMISNDAGYGRVGLLTDLIRFVFEHPSNKLIFIGDDAQLPPVHQTESPALRIDQIKSLGIPVVDEAILTDVVRQEQQSGILYNATNLRLLIQQRSNSLCFHTKGFADFYQMTGERLEDGLRYAYHHFGKEETIILCRSNAAATQYNKYIRQTIFFSDNEIDAGDVLMVIKNNYTALPKGHPLQFLANGEFMEIKRVIRMEEAYGHRFADVEVRFPDTANEMSVSITILLDTLHSKEAALSTEAWKNMLSAASKEYGVLNNKAEQAQALADDKYLHAVQVKFAYALTVHKSQGGQWDIVFVDQGYLTDDKVDTEWYRWLYTAITRGKKQVFLLNFKESFFQT